MQIGKCLITGCMTGVMILLAGCGGGGATTSSPVTPVDPNAACTAFIAPSEPAPAYSGRASAAVLDENSAQPMVAALLLQLNEISTLTVTMPGSSDFVSGCSRGQTPGVTFVDSVNADGSGWNSMTYTHFYTSFVGGSAFIDGTLYETFKPLNAAGTIVQETLRLYGLHFVEQGVIDVTYTGTFTFVSQRTDPTQPFNRTGSMIANDVVATDNVNHYVVMMQNMDCEDSSRFTNPWERQLTGRFYLSTQGFVDLSDPSPLQMTFTSDFPVPNTIVTTFGGPLILKGSQSAAYVEPLNDKFFAIGLDKDGDGVIDESARAVWATWTLDPSTSPNVSGPLPVLAVSSMPSVQQPAPLNGFASFGAGRYLKFAWTLLYSPPGSTASLASANSPAPLFVPDKVGEYLFRVSSTDGVASVSRDYVLTVPATAQSLQYSIGTDNPYEGVAGPDLRVNVGDRVDLDSGTGRGPGFWELSRPAGSSAALGAGTAGDASATASFVPDVPGIYVAALNNGSPDNVPDGYQIVIAGSAPHFDAPVGVNEDGLGKAFVTGDFNHDGFMDIAELESSKLLVFYGDGTGHFSVPSSIDLTGAGIATAPIDILAMDVNNDGRTDIVLSSPYGATVIFQQSNGTLGSLKAMQYPHSQLACNTSGTEPNALDVASWKGNSTRSLFVEGSCNSTLNVFDADSSGNVTLTSSQSVGLTASDSNLYMRVADVDNDGLSDLLVMDFVPGTSRSIDIFKGKSDGSFDIPIKLTLGLSSVDDPVFVVSDLSGDGLNDVAVVGGANLDVFVQNNAHGFSPVVQYPIFSPQNAFNWTQIWSIDLLGNGKQDLLLAYGSTEDSNNVITTGILATPDMIDFIGISLQNSTGSLDQQMLYPFSVASHLVTNGVLSAGATDFNGDRLPDLVILDGSGNLRIMFQGSLQ